MELDWQVFCETGDPVAYVLYRMAAGEQRE